MDFPTNRFPVTDSLPQNAQQRTLIQANKGSIGLAFNPAGVLSLDPKNDSSPDKIAQAMKQIADSIKETNISLSFSVDHDSGRPVVKITDQKTGELIRQIPSEDALHLAKTLESGKGVLFHAHA